MRDIEDCVVEFGDGRCGFVMRAFDLVARCDLEDGHDGHHSFRLPRITTDSFDHAKESA